ncbi:cupin domain-containing protein [Alkalihalobacillus sp. R86527]|uniref:cupin domain-containing protein n=1 Tax=Alkalihalobacillus sp. R86527 TaxID=3093863 RepID=UPI00366AF8C0
MNKADVETMGIPNNPDLPLLLYRGSLVDFTNTCAEQFKKNNWTNSWKNGVFDYHHYHSNTHEVLGIVSGEATITFGGENGEKVTVRKGDAVVIPAGVGHKRESASSDFQVVGAYPNGRDHDMKTVDSNERDALKAIQRVPFPETDPIFGGDGPLVEIWSNVNQET